MVAGEVCRGFFQELVFHLQFPVFPLGLAQPRPLAYGERRFFAGMVTAVGGDPVTEGAFVYSELLGYSGDRTRCLDHHFHCFVLVFRREALLRSWQNFTLSRSSILMDGLSGKSGTPHRAGSELVVAGEWVALSGDLPEWLDACRPGGLVRVR